MRKVPAEQRRAFHTLLDQILRFEGGDLDKAKERIEHLNIILGVIAKDGIDLRELRRVIKEAWQEKRRASHEGKRIDQERDRYQKQQRGQKGLAKAIPLLMESLPPTDPNRWIVDVLVNSTITNTSRDVSPPLGPIKRENVGNPPMLWIDNARNGLREAGVSEEETRETVLSIFGLKRKQE